MTVQFLKGPQCDKRKSSVKTVVNVIHVSKQPGDGSRGSELQKHFMHQCSFHKHLKIKIDSSKWNIQNESIFKMNAFSKVMPCDTKLFCYTCEFEVHRSPSEDYIKPETLASCQCWQYRAPGSKSCLCNGSFLSLT